jgi:hypothetical protein
VISDEKLPLENGRAKVSSFFLLNSDFHCRRISRCAQINLVFTSSQQKASNALLSLPKAYSPWRVVGENFRSLDTTPFSIRPRPNGAGRDANGFVRHNTGGIFSVAYRRAFAGSLGAVSSFI